MSFQLTVNDKSKRKSEEIGWLWLAISEITCFDVTAGIDKDLFVYNLIFNSLWDNILLVSAFLSYDAEV